jgi:hypothetical protein
MKIDTQELKNVAAAGAPRVDLYSGIHKAIRALMGDALVAVGRMDCDDGLDMARATERVMELLDFCSMHLEKENRFVHAAMEARAPGAAETIAHEHEEHAKEIAALASTVSALRGAPDGQRFAVQQELYAELSIFIAQNFRHMRVEETAHNAVLWARYTDAELQGIHDSIVASIPPEKMLFTARWLVPAMSPRERAGLLAGMKAHAPAPAFAAVMATVRPHLTDIEWAKLEAALS